MIDERELLERELDRFTPEPGILERIVRRRERKHRRQRLAAGALGVAIFAGVAVAAVTALRDPGPVPSQETSRPSPPPVPSPTPTELLLPDPLVKLPPGYHLVDIRTGEATPLPQGVLSVEGADHFDVSPDGSMILFDNARHTTASDEPPRRGFHQLFLVNIDGSGLRQLTDDPIGASQGSWSPDGTKIVYLGGWARLCCWHSPADLTVLDLGTGTTTVLAQGRAEDFYDPSFGPDGNSIAFTAWRDWSVDNEEVDLWTMPAEGGSPDLLLEDRGDGLLSPDGTSIVYRRSGVLRAGHCGSGFSMLWISGGDGSDPRALSPEATDGLRGTSFDQGVWSPDGTRVAYTEQLAPPEGCGWPDSRYGVYVMDVATGDRTFIAFGHVVDWVGDRTVLIRSKVAQMSGG